MLDKLRAEVISSDSRLAAGITGSGSRQTGCLGSSVAASVLSADGAPPQARRPSPGRVPPLADVQTRRRGPRFCHFLGPYSLPRPSLQGGKPLVSPLPPLRLSSTFCIPARRLPVLRVRPPARGVGFGASRDLRRARAAGVHRVDLVRPGRVGDDGGRSSDGVRFIDPGRRRVRRRSLRDSEPRKWDRDTGGPRRCACRDRLRTPPNLTST